MKRRTATALITVLAVSQLLFSGCSKKETTAEKKPGQAMTQEDKQTRFEKSKQDITAKVNGEPISMFTLLRQMNLIVPRFVKQGEQPSPELLKKIEKDALNTLIFQALAIQEAKKLGMKVKPEEIDTAIKNMKAKAGTEKVFQDYLADMGMNEDEVRRTIERERLYAMVVAQVGYGTVTVSDAAIRDRYKKEKKKLVTQDAERRQLSYDEAKGYLEQLIKMETAEKKLRDWEEQLKKKALIELAAG